MLAARPSCQLPSRWAGIENSSRWQETYWSAGFMECLERKASFKGKRIHIGDFDNQMEAAMAYDEAAELFGEFAWLNFPERIDLRNRIRKIIWPP